MDKLARIPTRARGASPRRGRKLHRRRRPKETLRAFTLVELLVVLFILAILVSLAVGVGMYVFGQSSEKQTLASMKVIMQAIEAYYDEGAPKVYPWDKDTSKPAATPVDPNTCGIWLSKCLHGKTASGADKTAPVLAAIERLRHLPKDAYRGDSAAFVDAWGNPIRYFRDGGLGRQPVLISAGPDGEFGDKDPNKLKDNVRSDENR